MLAALAFSVKALDDRSAAAAGPTSASNPSAEAARVLSHLGLRSDIVRALVTEAVWRVVPSQQICPRIVTNESAAAGKGLPRHRPALPGNEAKFLNDRKRLIATNSQYQLSGSNRRLVRMVL